MRQSLEFLLGLFDRDETPSVTQEDWESRHGPMLRLWQEEGLIAKGPGVNPAAGCPHCEDGVPYRLGIRILCNRCRSEVDPRHLLLWRLDLQAFLGWVATQWNLRGGVRRVDETLWQLGTGESRAGVYECFYRRGVPLSEAGVARVAAYRQAVVLFGRALPQGKKPDGLTQLSLLELVWVDLPPRLRDLASLMRPRGDVRFDPDTGIMWVGDTSLGEVPMGSKEFFFLRCLAGTLDRYVAYADLKREVLRLSGSVDSRDEASFCHRLKSRIKQRFIPRIDQFLVTTNKADGYRLVGREYRDSVV